MLKKRNKNKKSHKLGKSHKAKALMPRNLKSQGMSINVIIIAVVALIVLIVLIAIFTGRFGIFTGGLKEAGTCKALGGIDCLPSCSTTMERVYGAIDCGRNLREQGGENQEGKPVCCKYKSGLSST